MPQKSIDPFNISVSSDTKQIEKSNNLKIKEVVARIETLLANRDKLKAKYSRTLMVEPSEITTTSFDEQFIREVLEIIELNPSCS